MRGPVIGFTMVLLVLALLVGTALSQVSPEDSVSVLPSQEFAAGGNNVTFNCSAQGGPNNILLWLKNGIVLDGESSSRLTITNISEASSLLTITNITVEDGAEYSCLVSNAAGNGSVMASLFVVPEITQQPQAINTTNGSDVAFTCLATGYPSPEYIWSRENPEGIVVAMNVSVESQLNIDPVMFGDEGYYSCVAFIDDNAPMAPMQYTDMSEAALLTISPEDGVTGSPRVAISTIGSDANFTCEALGGPGNQFRWLKNYVVLSTQSMLTISVNSGSGDGGDYTCLVTNAAGNGSDTVSVYVRPDITTQPTDINTVDGTNVSFSCAADGFPMPTFSWEKEDGNTFTQVVGATNQTLRFNPAMFSDEGRYQCIATVNFPMGPDNMTTSISNLATLTISPGEIETIPKVENFNISVGAVFNCTALGGPSNVYTWTRLSDGVVVSNVPVLNFTVESAFDGSIYQCSVENNAGNISSEVTLNVSPAILVPPVLLNVTFMEESIFLSCNASGFPVPTISWSHNGTDINSTADPRLSIVQQERVRSILSTLEVNSSNVNVNDSGEYVCSASNNITEFGDVMSDPVIVLVQDVPEQPQNVSGIANNSTAIRLMWTEPHDNNALITGYVIRYEQPQFQGGQEVNQTFPPEPEVAVIIGLHSGLTYKFTVEAFNGIGVGNPSTEIEATTLEEPPSSPPSNVNATVESSTSIRVIWGEVPAIDRNGFITQYEVMYEPLETFGGQLAARTNMTDTNSTFEILIENLQEYVQYNITVRAYTQVGEGPFSPNITFRTREAVPASAPLAICAANLSATEIRVDWEQVNAIDRNGIITHYEVQFTQTTFTEIPMTNTANTTSNVLNLNLTNLEEFVEYMVTVRAFTAIGAGPYNTLSASSTTFEATPVASPGNLIVANVTGSSTMLNITWNRPDEIGINGQLRDYVILYSIAGVNETNSTIMVPGNTLETVLDGLQNFTRYIVYVSASTIDLGPFAEGSERTSENVPGAPPEDVSVFTESSTSISVQWSPPPEEVLFGIPRGYRIRYTPLHANGSLRMALFANVPYANTSDLLVGLEEFTDYSIEVAAVTIDAGVYSDPIVNIAEQDIAGRPPTPPEIPPGDISSTSVRVTWNEPPVPNGVITRYTVNVRALALQTFVRRRRQVDGNDFNNCITGKEVQNLTFPGNTNEARLQNLTAFAQYEFSVQAETMVGPGDFSPPRNFSTTESTPLEPRDLNITVQSSTQLLVMWNHPLCDNGIRTLYTVFYEPLAGPYEPLGDLGRVECPMLLTGSSGNLSTFFSNTTGLTLSDLTPFTNYSITVFASTSAGDGLNSILVQQTEETVPDSVTSLEPNSTRNATDPSEVLVSLKWTPPSPRNGPYMLLLNYTAEQTSPYPASRANKNNNNKTLPQSSSQFTIRNALPFANYTVTIYAVNIKLGLVGVADSTTIRSQPIEPSAVTNLRTDATSSSSIFVQWTLPLQPNSEITSYEVYYKESDTIQVASSTDPMNDNSYTTISLTPSGGTDTPPTSVFITGLTPVTNYTIRVRAIGQRLNGDNSLFGDIASSEKIFLESTTPPEPTVSSEPTTSQSTTSSTRDPIATYAIIGAVVAPATIIILVLAVVIVIIVWLYLNHKRAMMSFQRGARDEIIANELAQSEYDNRIVFTGCAAYGTALKPAQDEEHEYETIPLSPIPLPRPGQVRSSTVTPQTSDDYEVITFGPAFIDNAPTQTSGAGIVSVSGSTQGRDDDSALENARNPLTAAMPSTATPTAASHHQD